MGWQDDPVVSGWENDAVVGAPASSGLSREAMFKSKLLFGEYKKLGFGGTQEELAKQLDQDEARKNDHSAIAQGMRDVPIGALAGVAGMADISSAIQNPAAAATRYVNPNSRLMQTSGAVGQLDELVATPRNTPQTLGQRLTRDITRGVSGAAATAGIGSAANIPMLAAKPGLQMLSGATGATSAGLTREAGGGPVLQTLAGLAGGMAPPVISGLSQVAGQTAKNMVTPLTNSGQQQMAADIIQRQATNPAAAKANLAAAQDVIPGSQLTSGAASKDIGLLALEKGLRGKNAAAFGTRISEQNAARQAAISGVAGNADDVAAMQAARDATTAPMREAAFANAGKSNPVAALEAEARKAGYFEIDNPTPAQMAAEQSWSKRYAAAKAAPQEAVAAGLDAAPIHAKIDAILASPMGKRETISKTMGWVKGLIGDETDPASLYEIRKDLQLAQRGKLQPTSPNAPAASVLALAKGQIGDVINTLDNSIESAAPGFKAYLARYKEMSLPIDQAKIMQEIQKRAQLQSMDVTTQQQFLGAANYGRAVDAAIAKNPGKLSVAQVEQLNAIRTDLQMGQAINSPLVKAPGSDTFQNLSIAQVLGAGETAVHPMLKVIAKPLQWMYKIGGTDESVNEILTSAMLDPKLAAKLLDRATPQSVQTFAESLKIKALAGALGTQAQLAATQSKWTEDKNTQPETQAAY